MKATHYHGFPVLQFVNAVYKKVILPFAETVVEILKCDQAI